MIKTNKMKRKKKDIDVQRPKLIIKSQMCN